MTGHGAKFGRKKGEAIVALLSHRNVEDAARAAGVGTTTLLRWLKMAEFQKAYREARRLSCGQTIARLQQASGAAVTTLLKLAVDTNAPPAVRARASYYILNLSRQWMETDDIEVRLAELEEAADRAQRER
jgi:hypothetical protein